MTTHFLQIFRRGFLAMILAAAMLLSPRPAHAVLGLSDAFMNMGDGDIVATRTAAQQQIVNWPKYPNTPTSLPFRETFEGYFKPTSNDTKIALFSDDGVRLEVDGVVKHDKLDKGQALPDLNQSFFEVSYAWQANRLYKIKITYSNTFLTSGVDVDGLTFFAYDGGGEVIDTILQLRASDPNFITYRAPQIPMDEPVIPLITAEASTEDAPGTQEAEEGDLDESGSSDPSTEVYSEPSGWEPESEAPTTLTPTPDASVEHPVIHFGVRVVGYQTWKATVKVYPIPVGNGALGTPLATFETTNTDVTWDDLFPTTKPASGTYQYNIELEGTFDPAQPPSAEQNIGLTGTGEEKERLNQNVLVRDLQFEVLDDADAAAAMKIKPSSARNAKALTGTTDDGIKVRIKLKFVDPAGAIASLDSTYLKLVKPDFVPEDEVALTKDGDWWIGTWTLKQDSVEKMGDWILVAGGIAPVKGNFGRTAVAAKQVADTKPVVTGIALGFDATNPGGSVATVENSRRLAVGITIGFRAFLRIKTMTKPGTYQIKWYSNEKISDLSKYAWIGAGGIEGAASFPADVRKIADSWKAAGSLHPVITWREFENRTIQQHPGKYRWYGMVPLSGGGSGFKFERLLTQGTHWWGARVSWRGVWRGANGAAETKTLNYDLPTDRAGGVHLTAWENNNAEYQGANLVSGLNRYNILNYLDGAQATKQHLWLPNPQVTAPSVSGWTGRISGMPIWAVVNFAAHDPMFPPPTPLPPSPTQAQIDNHNADVLADIQKRTKQGEFQTDLVRNAYAFLNVPYSWGGQTFGGRQSATSTSYTLSDLANSIPDGICKMGMSKTRAGYGVDCNGFVTEVANLSGIWFSPGDGPSAGALKTNGVEVKDIRHLREGDFIPYSGHVVYLISAPSLLHDALGRVTGIDKAQTIEAKPAEDNQSAQWNKVQEYSRGGKFLRDRNAVYRRWVAP